MKAGTSCRVHFNVLIPRALAYFFGTSLVDAAWHRGFSAGMRFGWSNKKLEGFYKPVWRLL